MIEFMNSRVHSANHRVKAHQELGRLEARWELELLFLSRDFFSSLYSLFHWYSDGEWYRRCKSNNFRWISIEAYVARSALADVKRRKIERKSIFCPTFGFWMSERTVSINRNCLCCSKSTEWSEWKRKPKYSNSSAFLSSGRETDKETKDRRSSGAVGGQGKEKLIMAKWREVSIVKNVKQYVREL